MPAKLTEKAIAAAIKRAGAMSSRVEIADETLPGLRLRINPKGSASWVLACRDSFGRMRRFEVATWPKDGIAAARDAAREMRVRVRGGEDPIADRKRTRALGRDAAAGIGTLGALVSLYGSKVGDKIKSWPATRRRIEMVFEGAMKVHLAELVRQDLQMAADGYAAPQQASGAVSGLRVILKWGAGRDYSDPALVDLRSPALATRRDRVLTRDELTRLLPVLAASDRPYAAALRFMLLTLARREEVCGARWRDLDLRAGTWRIAAARSKNKVEHIVPLSQQALDVIRLQPRRETGALVFASRTGGHLTNWDRATKVVMEASGTDGWTRHDLRRTGATMLGDMGETPDIVEAALNHVAIRSQIAATYNRSRYRPQVALALQRLADTLDGIAAGGAEVVPLRTIAEA